MRSLVLFASVFLLARGCDEMQNLGGGGGAGGGMAVSSSSSGRMAASSSSGTMAVTVTSSSGMAVSSSSSGGPSCMDGIQDDMESDVDCGGPCPPCAAGKRCFGGFDCASNLCMGGICQPNPSSCMDGVKDGAETDVDCGGPACPRCAQGQACILPSDCTTGFCLAGVCAISSMMSSSSTSSGSMVASSSSGGIPPSCTDGIQDDMESDVDCGGPCPPCADGKRCFDNHDCTSDFCSGFVCGPPTFSCMDGVKDGPETDVDCGSTSCPPCALGKECKVDTDCVSNACDALTLICVANQCLDHALDGTETDIDCGGPTCAPCAAGKRCLIDADCATMLCMGDICQP
jgi:hypothetical protein